MSKSFVSVRGTALALVALPLAMLIAGCGGGDGAGFHINGVVTHNGQPIPRGQITFSPDTSKGNSGPGTAALIEDGKYSTRGGLGTVGGPHIVRIEGFDGVADGENVDGELLFPTYTTEVDLPAASGEVNFDVKN